MPHRPASGRSSAREPRPSGGDPPPANRRTSATRTSSCPQDRSRSFCASSSAAAEVKGPPGSVVGKGRPHAGGKLVVEPERAPLVGGGVEVAGRVDRAVTEQLAGSLSVVGVSIEPVVRREVAHDVRVQRESRLATNEIAKLGRQSGPTLRLSGAADEKDR